MDSNLIYLKTASGEEAMHQRTRVMQRNLRMVLILVDGKSTVSDLVLRIGNQALTESALAELTRDYEVNRDIYQDMLRRRENARVSMELDRERRGGQGLGDERGLRHGERAHAGAAHAVHRRHLHQR